MRYKIGDIVTIKNPLEGTNETNSSMWKLSGKKAIIKAIRLIRSTEWYKIDIDNQEWVWSDDMLQDIKSEIQIRRLEHKRKKIIAELRNNKDFRKCFKDIKKEVSLWSFDIIENYRLGK